MAEAAAVVEPRAGEIEPREGELVAILAATAEETGPLLERIAVQEEIADGPRRYKRGTLRGVPVVLAITGEGKRNADMVARRVAQKLGPTRILGLGLGGALSPKMRAEEIIVSSEVMEGESVLAWPDLQWLDRAELQVEHDQGRLVTVDEILSTPQMKDEWWGKTMRDQPAVCDMESACFARVAAAYQIPYLVIRAVSDTADETLPHYLEDCRAQDGRLDRRQVMWKAFWRPGSWRMLWKLHGRLKRCSRLLADAAEQLVGALERH